MLPEPRIAILEDSPELREELLFFLNAQGLGAWGANSAEAFWKHLHQRPVDIVIVDIGLPGEDGFSVVSFLKCLRQNHGLIVITARGATHDRQRGLALGADFYLIKPINFAELLQNIQALWQRILTTREADKRITVEAVTHASSWRLTARGLFDPSGKCLPLTPREHRLMEILYQRRNEVCSKALLHDLMFQDDSADLHRIDVIISRLRNKARRLGIPLDIRSIFGRGVTFLDQTQEHAGQ